MPPPVVTVSRDTSTDIITTSWTYDNQKSFKVAIVRESDGRHGEPSYGTERFKGQFTEGGAGADQAGDLQAHWIGETTDANDRRRGRNIQSIEWNGRGVSSDTICTGTWIVIVRCRNIAGTEDLTTVVMGAAQQSARTVTRIPCPAGDELPKPIFEAPAANKVFNGTEDQVFTFRTPDAGHVASDWKLSIFRAADVDGNGEPLEGRTDIGGTWRTGESDLGRSHWVPDISLERSGRNRTVRFSGGLNEPSVSERVRRARDTTGKLCGPGTAGIDYVARLRYETAGRRRPDGSAPRSQAAILRFKVTNVDCVASPTVTPPPPPPTDPIPEGEVGLLTLLTGVDYGLLPDTGNPPLVVGEQLDLFAYAADLGDLTLQWSVVFRSGLPQVSYKIERRLAFWKGPDPNPQNLPGSFSRSIIHYFNGDATGDIWETTDQTVPSAEKRATLKGDPPSTATFAANGLQYWWSPYSAWGTPTAPPAGGPGSGFSERYEGYDYRITAYDSAGNAARSDWFRPVPAPRILVTSITQDTTTITAGGRTRTVPRISVTAPGLSLNETSLSIVVEDVKLAIYDYQGNIEREIEAGTIRALGQEIPPAHYTPWELVAGSDTRPNPYQFLITPSLYWSNAIPADKERAPGLTIPTRFLAAAKVRDVLGRESDNYQARQTVAFNWTPAEPQRRDIIPMRIVRLDDDGDPVFERPPAPATFLAGLGPGIGIAIAYFRPSFGLSPGAENAKPTPDDAIIQRREFSRTDGRAANTTPRDIFRFADTEPGPSTLPAETGVTVYDNLEWFYDYSVASGVQYEYQAVLLDTRTGGRRERGWLPVGPAIPG